jgi:hypothetical protein
MLLMLVAAMTATQAPQLRTIDLTGKPVVTITEPFTAPQGLNEISGNRAIVIDNGDRKLAMVDFAHDAVTTLGRRGEGPGEFRMISSAWPMPGGSTLVPDRALYRALVVSPDGKLSTANYAIRDLGVSSIDRTGGVDNAGRVYLPGIANGATADSVAIVRWSPRTTRLDTLAAVPMVKVVRGPAQMVGGRVGYALITPGGYIYPDRTIWRALPAGGIVIAHPAPYRIEIIDNAGKRHLGPIVDRPRIKIDGAERDAYRRERGPGMPDSDFWPAYPPFIGIGNDGMFVTPAGGIWIERSRRLGDTTAVYDVFDATGRLTSEARLRPNSKILSVGKSSVYIARQTTDDDFWHLEQWRLPN